MLYLHRSSRADYLVDALGDVLLKPLPDPMAREVVAVPTRGVERWLAQRLSHRLGARAGAGDGVSANIHFPFPGVLVADAMAAVCGAGALGSASDPWSPERSVWALMALVDKHLDDAVLGPLAAYLRAASPLGPGKAPRRFTAVRHLADLYDHYAVHRPSMLLAWKERAEDTLPTSRPEDMAWQAELWRRLHDSLGVPSLAERFEAAPARIEAEPDLLDLPSRISLFGLTRLPDSHLRVLKAISAHRDVHLYLLHPSGALWEKVASAGLDPSPGLPRRDDLTPQAVNPLLRSWGRDAREMQLVLASRQVTRADNRDRPGQQPASTLLGRLQADIRADREPPGAPPPGVGSDRRPPLAKGDDSLRVHSCHGRARQVEVLREAVLHLLDADPTLEPRDVIVMCPDIELFAPLVKATFEGAGLAGAPELRARLADRSLRQTNPLLAVAAHLLELAGSRVTVSQVLDFASREPVARQFGFDQDQDMLSAVERWLSGTGVRWGLDASHRRAWRLERVEVGTWRAGLDRILLGIAMAEDERLFGGILPFGDLTSDEIDLAGRLAELLDRLGVVLDELQGSHTLEQWAKALVDGTARLARSAPGESWQDEQLRMTLGDGSLERVSADGEGGGRGDEVQVPGSVPRSGPTSLPGNTWASETGSAPIELDLSEVRALLADRLRGRPTRANFRTGDLTICTLVPMRSVPHRVVCLLGLDDGLFPRPAEQDGDDLLLADPQVGDRDVPSEDRQLLLDALMAATEHLIITFEGRDQHLNQRRPPAVPVAELLDVVDKTVRLDGSQRPAREVVVVQHPLQAFDPTNFTPGSLSVAGPWRFDGVYLEGANAVTGRRRSGHEFLPQRLPPLSGPQIQLSSLVRFLEHPVKAFLRERLGYYAGDVPDQLSDALPVEMGPLDRWELGDRLLEARLGGADLGATLMAEQGRGLLPPGALGDVALTEVKAVVEALVAEVEGLPCGRSAATSVEVNVALSDGHVLVGTVPGVRESPGVGESPDVRESAGRESMVLRCTYSKLAAKHRLRSWVYFLALSASRPELSPSAVTIGQAEGSTGAKPRLSTSTLSPLVGDPGGAAIRGHSCTRDPGGSLQARYARAVTGLLRHFSGVGSGDQPGREPDRSGAVPLGLEVRRLPRGEL